MTPDQEHVIRDMAILAIDGSIYKEHIDLLLKEVDVLRSSRNKLWDALCGLMASIEAYTYVTNSKPEDNWDEYDYGMAPLWKRAEEVLRSIPKD